MDFSLFAPRATRDSVRLRKRIQSDALRAYDKYKLEQEQIEAERIKVLAEGSKDDVSSKSDNSYEDIKARAFSSTKRDFSDEDDEDGSQSTYSGHTVFNRYAEHYGVIGRCCSKLFGGGVKYELTWKEFFTFSYCLQIPLFYIVRHINLIRKWGALLILLVYITVAFTVGMPIFMVCMFMGNYGRRGFFKFWECVPLFRGIAYSITIAAVIHETYNVAFASMALMYLKNIVGVSLPWINCNFPNVHPDCVPAFAAHSVFNVTCCDEFVDINCTLKKKYEAVIKYSAKDYYRSYILQLGYEERPIHDGLLWRWIVMAEITWFMIFIGMTVGLRKIRGIMCILNICVFVLYIPVIILTLIVSVSYSSIPKVKTNYRNMLNYNFWIESTIHTLNREVPGDIVFLSGIAKPGINTVVNTLSIYSLKVLFVTLIVVWLSVSVQLIQKHYKVKDPVCVDINGDAMIYAVLPDMISHWYYPQVWLTIYFATIYYWGLAGSVYSLNAMLESMLEEYPMLIKWRPVVCAVFCVTAGTGNAFLLSGSFMDTFRNILSVSYIHLKITLLLLSLTGIYLYSEQRLKNDYNFTYGTMLGSYWAHGLKIAILVIGMLAMLIYIKYTEISRSGFYMLLAVVLPTLIGMVTMTLRYILHINNCLLDPDPRWGPVGRKRKLARIRFDPTHDLRYRSNIRKCRHTCLIHSFELKKEIKYWNNKKHVYNQQVENEKTEKL